MLGSWMQDLRYAARLLRRNPIFALTESQPMSLGGPNGADAIPGGLVTPN